MYGTQFGVAFCYVSHHALWVERDANLLILGARVRALRTEKGLSQEKLADLSHVHRNFIGFIERGERNVGVRTIIALAQAMELPPSAIFEGCAFEPVGPDEADRSS